MSLDLNKTSIAEKSDEMDTDEVKQEFQKLTQDKEEGELDDEEEDYDDNEDSVPDNENKTNNSKEEEIKPNVKYESIQESELKETNELIAQNLQSLKKFQQEQINMNDETQENKEVVLATILPIRSQLIEDDDEYDDDDDYDDEYSLSNKRLKIDEDDSNNLIGDNQTRSGDVLVDVLAERYETNSIQSFEVQDAPMEHMDSSVQTLIAQQTVDVQLADQITITNEQSETTAISQNQIDDNKNEAEVEKITSGASKQIDIENQIESDGPSTRSSSSSSALTNISSASSSNSLTKLNETINTLPTNQETEAIDTDSNSNKTVVESGAETNSSLSSINKKSEDLETDSGSDKNENKSEESELSSNKLKVPPLKIICSNPNGGLPYIKSQQQANQTIRSNEVESSGTLMSNITLDMPLTRNKANKARVISPITTSTNSTAPTRTTPTRRSQLINNQTHANPASNNVLNANQGRSSPVVNPTNNAITSYNNNNNNSEIANGESISESAADNLTRRKLRSHTRQLQGGETSGSPLTLPSEITSTTSTSQEISAELNNSNQQQVSKEEIKLNEAYVFNEPDGIKSDSSANALETLNTRKRRYRTQQQQQQPQPQPTQTSNKDNIVDQNEQKSSSQSVSLLTNQVSNELNQAENVSNCDSSEPQISSDQNNCSSEMVTASTTSNSTSEQVNSQSNTTTSLVNPTNTESILNLKPASCIKKYLEIKNDLLKRRDSLIKTHIELRYPNNFKEFFLNKKNYLIRQNKDIQQTIPFFKTPNELHDELKEYFMKQERERYSLRLRHRIEQDKLSILYEQEVLRCFANLGREVSSQTVPLGFCSIFNDEENYSQHNSYLYSSGKAKVANQTSCNSNSTNEDLCPAESIVSIAYEEKLLNSLTQTNNKFQKFKEDLIKRQLNESDSLHAVQKMDFQSKYSELSHKQKLASNNQSNSNSANKLINANTVSSPFLLKQTDIHVPIVHVNSKFELFDLSQLMSYYQLCANTNCNNNSNNSNVD